jgi:tetratricopeptide (TPR) repeat protein
MKSTLKLKDQARHHEQREEWGRAIELYLQVLEQGEAGTAEPDLPLYNRVGDLLLRQGKARDAVVYYERAADRYAEAGLFNNAIALCNKALRHAPERVTLIQKLGQFSAAQGFLTDARRYFLEFAQRQLRAGHLEDAIIALGDFADLTNDPDVRELLGRQLLAHGHPEHAGQQLSLVYRDRLARGQAEQARALADEMRQLDPALDLESAAPPAQDAGTAAVEERAGRAPGAAPERRGGWDAAPLPGLDTFPPREESPAADLPLIPVDEPEPEPVGEPQPEPEPPRAEEEVVAPPPEGFELTRLDEPEPPSGPAPPSEQPSPSPDDGGDLAMDLPWLDAAPDAEDDAGFDEPRTAAEPEGVAEPVAEAEAEAEDRDEDDAWWSAPTTLGHAAGRATAEPEPSEPPEPQEDEQPSEDAADGFDEAEEGASAPALEPAPPLAAEGSAVPAGDDASEVVARARELIAEGRTAEAVALLQRLHRSLAERGEVEEALAIAAALLRHAPDDLAAHQQRVEYAFRLGRPAALVDGYLDLADCLVRSGAGGKAAVVYQRVLELEPGNERATAAQERYRREQAAQYVDLGALLEEEEEEELPSTRFVVEELEPTGDEERDFAELLAQFRAKVDEHVGVEDSASHYDLGLAFKEMGLIDEAIAEFQTAMRGGEHRLKVLEELGQCFLLKGQYNVAVKVLRRALQMPHGEPAELVGVHYHLGRCYEALGQPEEAREAYERVFGVDAGFGDVRKRLAAL